MSDEYAVLEPDPRFTPPKQYVETIPDQYGRSRFYRFVCTLCNGNSPTCRTRNRAEQYKRNHVCRKWSHGAKVMRKQ